MTRWIIAIVAALVVGGVATFYFRRVVMRRDETAAGIDALSAMSWRDYIHLLLAALAERGYVRVFDREAPSGDDDYTLERNGGHWLLSCKHGSAFVLGSMAIGELAQRIRLANAAGGILATQGRIAAEARQPAALQRIELLDGPGFWPELREQLPPAQLAAIRASAARKARRRVLLSWLLALLVGVGCFIAIGDPGSSTGATPDPTSSSARSGTDAPDPVQQATIAAPADAPSLEQQRQDVARSVSALPMVDRAVWATHSTLQVYLIDTEQDAFAQVCPLIVRYDALASSRVQLTPPVGSSQQTRFRQCRSY